MDCGIADPVVLEFDHVGEKRFDVGKGFEAYGWNRVLEEIASCEVVCANCHRRRTAERRGALRLILGQDAAG